ncbi:MAG: type I DNA topoisomerase [Armatimonadetes bacterium]|nr:type I DNA topoisomerase [Armatimonadota bacterium]MDI9585984.1 type I DNA topoisomerase [Acidobacteriota bacterium]
MTKSAIIVESPTKTRTLKRFLGDEYKLLASMGHVRDLPESELAVDVEGGFKPRYVTDARQSKVLGQLKKALKGVDKVYLASDPDREGEAIAWHLAEALGLGDAERIEFNEITETAVREALNHPRKIDMERVNAQQARRILDRLVGYLLSPLLWEKVAGRARGSASLSAGRVQSAALRLICEREREIAAFVPEEYWSVTATLTPEGEEIPFTADLKTKDGEDLELKTEEQVTPIVEELRQLQYAVDAVEKKERRRNPQPPFITSTLQRAAASELYFSARKTMLIAQELYQGVDMAEGTVGLITYMRTDSTRIADQARTAAVSLIKERHGDAYVGPGAKGKQAKGAQDAHEAIRPTYVDKDPESVRPFLSADQFKLYDLIWRRFIASQMSAAVFDQTTLSIQAGPYGLRATGSVLKFPGFLSVLKGDPEEDEDEKTLPELIAGQALRLLDVAGDQHFTKPPPRYTESTLVRALEENGVGRPSTYAQIIETLRQRKYVRMQSRQFVATATGMAVNDYLVERFPDIVDVEFTARVEDDLDGIEQGETDWAQLLRAFYEPFKEKVEEAQSAPLKELEGERCPECGGRLLERYSLYGKFAGCENYPGCTYKKDLTGDILPRNEPKPLGEKCPECGADLVVRQGRRGEFVGCSGYPKCRYTRPLEGEKKPRRQAIETDILCDKCEKKNMVIRFGRRGPFLGCAGYPRCRNTRNLTDDERAKWLPDEPEGEESESGEEPSES